MYVYIYSRSEKLHVVGFYDPDGKFQPESDHSNSEDAAKRVHWLNGGNDVELEELRSRIEAHENADDEGEMSIAQAVQIQSLGNRWDVNR